jgi:hypothetical protein
MRAAGRVYRLPDGWVYNASSVDADMQSLTVDGVRRFLQTADIMKSVLKDATVSLRKDAVAPVGPTRRKGKS